MNAVPMIRGGSHASSSSASRNSPFAASMPYPMYDERIGVDLAQVVEVVGQVLGRLTHRLHRGDGDAAPTTLLTEVAEVLLAVRRDLAQHRDALVSLLGQPRDDERGVAADITVAESEAVVTLQPLGARPTEQRHLHLVGERRDGDRVVGAVRAGHADAALVDEVPEPVGGVAWPSRWAARSPRAARTRTGGRGDPTRLPRRRPSGGSCRSCRPGRRGTRRASRS